MTVDIREMQLFIRQLDPGRPLDAGDPLYVQLDAGTSVRGGDGWSCIDELERTVVYSDPASRTRQLFTGFPGAGKTTELLRLQARFNANQLAPVHAIYVDFEEYVDRYVPLSITDVLRVLAYALDREATLAEGGDPAQKPGYLLRLYTFLANTNVELQKIGFQQGGASLMLELKNNPTFREQIESALGPRFQKFAREATDTMAEAVVRLRKATGAAQIVVIADGLEKITPLREEERGRVESSVESVFVQHASWLELPCHVIYTFPLWLRFRATLGALYDREPQVLPMVKIAGPDGHRYEPGHEKLATLIGRRADLGKVFGADLEGTLHAVIAASGGYPRDLLRMVRELLWTARTLPVTPKDVERIVGKMADAYGLMIRTPDLDVLAEIAKTHEIPKGDGVKIADFGRLVERWIVLAYRNGKEWYDLHPLVRSTPIVREWLARPSAPPGPPGAPAAPAAEG
jgi:hypothetical protein